MAMYDTPMWAWKACVSQGQLHSDVRFAVAMEDGTFSTCSTVLGLEWKRRLRQTDCQHWRTRGNTLHRTVGDQGPLRINNVELLLLLSRIAHPVPCRGGDWQAKRMTTHAPLHRASLRRSPPCLAFNGGLDGEALFYRLLLTDRSEVSGVQDQLDANKSCDEAVCQPSLLSAQVNEPSAPESSVTAGEPDP